MKRLITATVMLGIETESELPLDQIQGYVEDEIGMRLPTIPLPTSEHMGFPWESARVPRAHVERITEQGGEKP